ncbi:hypothetical protein EDC01DRAFT_635077 [Geopyxis carbonaria]|nr:hypothetical protein EDC01DRAFT_635077 [Geopyxis carbonaria]
MSTSLKAQHILLDKIALTVDSAARCIGRLSNAPYSPRDKIALLHNLSSLQERNFARHPLPTAVEIASFKARYANSGNEAKKIVDGFQRVTSRYKRNCESIEEMIKWEESELEREEDTGSPESFRNSGYFGNCESYTH